MIGYRKNEIEEDRSSKEMNIINIEHITKRFGDKFLFEDASFGVQEGDKIGIVGINGTGKSTLLKALETGVYPHIAGDGREYVITDATAVKLRSEDGRVVKNVDISLFINDLPNKRDTTTFSTLDASGSTSQAAGTVESMEANSRSFSLTRTPPLLILWSGIRLCSRSSAGKKNPSLRFWSVPEISMRKPESPRSW